ncbi:MAG TPA: acetyl-CoA carboxylase biotin carboxyl carrier protein subunit [Candidatus Limnocylindrales bacterium]|nr:acetyl-CoA carboxylase biotin carboxyl carrier protein subunit [Candidatus Limnocylindrales bacterium]
MPVEIKAPITGSVWKIVKVIGDTVKEYDVIMVIESMKMEIPVEAPQNGRITAITVQEGASVIEEETVAVLD